MTDTAHRSDPANRSDRGEQTRAAIATAAQELFRERGYDKTTMRAVADRAGVSIGNAYYYFASKEHLVQAFYDQIQVEHAAAAQDALGGTDKFADRLRAVLITWVDVAESFHEFAGKFFKVAAEPTSPLSPFSSESKGAREASIGLFRQVVEGSDLKVPAVIRAELPELLWLLQMGVVLFWVHDSSDGQKRTRALVRQVVPLVDKLVRLSRLPGMRGVVGDITELIRSVRS
ncbi:DNA-binding transcriptional regulator, AcrR family [Pedococcus dokdonensis]|uniref:DNA-binding transcriptional regulator, AcrR family n=1 Tax=Pedococcus dokdonensis TaxID=443156 RepID=A0A1H0REF6_9MICO|nr:TetR family transcriptional regulator [Pedococcus dokdonensis]SDP27426.1 DNA-binding transcriptional regulator, AcrR family [Pedococcus dokdonensis]